MSAEPRRDGGAVFWVATAVGWIVIGAAIVGVLSASGDTQPADLARWVVGGALVHDFLWLPIVALVGTVLARVTRGRTPGPVRWALATTALLTIVAWPFVRGYGRQATNPSLLPRNYARGLLAYIVAVWVTALLVTVGGARPCDGGAAGRVPTPAPANDLAPSPDGVRAP